MPDNEQNPTLLGYTKQLAEKYGVQDIVALTRAQDRHIKELEARVQRYERPISESEVMALFDALEIIEGEEDGRPYFEALTEFLSGRREVLEHPHGE